jgi:hypothetical protein
MLTAYVSQGLAAPTATTSSGRRRVAAELIADLERVHARKKAANKELTELVAATGTGLMGLPGIGPSGAARLLVEVGDITRFPDKAHFASGTAPHPSTPPPGTGPAPALTRWEPADQPGSCTSWPASRSATPAKDTTTTNATRPTARRPWKPCDA